MAFAAFGLDRGDISLAGSASDVIDHDRGAPGRAAPTLRRRRRCRAAGAGCRRPPCLPTAPSWPLAQPGRIVIRATLGNLIDRLQIVRQLLSIEAVGNKQRQKPLSARALQICRSWRCRDRAVPRRRRSASPMVSAFRKRRTAFGQDRRRIAGRKIGDTHGKLPAGVGGDELVAISSDDCRLPRIVEAVARQEQQVGPCAGTILAVEADEGRESQVFDVARLAKPCLSAAG